MANFPNLLLKSAYFSILLVEFSIYGPNWLIFLLNKTKKMNKIKKYADFYQAGKISVQLDVEYYKTGENAKIWKT